MWLFFIIRRKREEGRGKKEDIVLIDVICYAKALVDWEESVTFANCMETTENNIESVIAAVLGV